MCMTFTRPCWSGSDDLRRHSRCMHPVKITSLDCKAWANRSLLGNPEVAPALFENRTAPGDD